MKLSHHLVFLLGMYALPALAQPAITIQPTNQVVFNGGNVTIAVLATGIGPLTYVWQFNGTNLPNSIINTVAGKGASYPFGGGFSGDGGTATNANFYSPSGIARDSVGRLYISDTYNNRIRRVDTNGVVMTVAGNGIIGFAGDGGDATNANLNLNGSLGVNAVAGLGIDKNDNLYFADLGNNRIRKIDTNGLITTVIGNGNASFSGDGGHATDASLNQPTSLAFDSLGNLYIADMGNSRIRKVDTNGIITTIAGGGGISANLISGPSGAFSATDVGLNSPYGVGVDVDGNVFIADTYNERIEKVDTNGMLTIIAGYGILEGFSGDGGPSTNAQVVRPKGVAIDPSQNLYILDTLNQRVREVDTNGIISTVIGNGAGYPNGAFGGDGGVATNASLQNPFSAVFTSSGNMYLADAWNNRIRFISFRGVPRLDLSNVSMTNTGDYSVVISDSSGSVTSSVATLTVQVPATIYAQPTNQMVAVGRDLSLNVGAYGTLPLHFQWFYNGDEINGETNALLALGNAATNQAGSYFTIVTNIYGSVTSSVAVMNIGYLPNINMPSTNLTIIQGSNLVLSADVTGSGSLSCQWQLNGTNLPNNKITTVAGKTGSGFSGDNGMATNANLNTPVGVASDGAGNIYIADSHNNRIRKVDLSGAISTVAGNGSASYAGDGGFGTNASFYYPNGIAIDPLNNIYIADSINNRVRKLTASLIVTTIAGTNSFGNTGDGGLATVAKLYRENDVALDADGNIYIADTLNNRIRKVDTNGIISTVAGTGVAGFSGDGGVATSAKLNYPYCVAVDLNGSMYIADNRNNRIRKVDTNGIIQTISGKGPSYPSPGTYSGDGGPATNAYINNPRSVAIDQTGNLFIADAGNHRIRKVDAGGIINTVAGRLGYGFSGDGGSPTNAALNDPEGIAFDAVGNLLIADTANARIREVFLYANYSTLNVHNANLANAGNYSLVVTSPYGSVTGNVAAVTVLMTPMQFRGQLTNGNLQIEFSGTPNYSYILESTTNLATPTEWQSIVTNQSDNMGYWQYSATNMTNIQEFYRAVGK